MKTGPAGLENLYAGMAGMDELIGLYHFILRNDEIRISIIKTINKNVQNYSGQINSLWMRNACSVIRIYLGTL